MREPISMKFGTQQHVRATMIKSHNHILKFLKFKVADGRHVGKYWHTITRLAMELLGRNLAGRIPSRARHVRQNGVTMAMVAA